MIDDIDDGDINSLTLYGKIGSDNILRDDIKNFITLTNDGECRETVAASLSGFRTKTVKEGTLALTGNNTGYSGDIFVKALGALEASSQSLPTKTVDSISHKNIDNIVNDGIVGFKQDIECTYIG